MFSPNRNPRLARLTVNYEDVSGERNELTIPLDQALPLYGYLRQMIDQGRLQELAKFAINTAQEMSVSFGRNAVAPSVSQEEPTLLAPRSNTFNREPMLARFYEAALENRLAIVVGDSASDSSVSVAAIGAWLNETLQLGVEVTHPWQYYQCWDELLDVAKKRIRLEELRGMVRSRIESAKATEMHRFFASIPISNFVDLSLDRGLAKALRAAGRQPIEHEGMGMIGNWQQSESKEPNVFYGFGNTCSTTGFWMPVQILSNPRQTIAREGLREMLLYKDVLLAGVNSYEAEYVLNLGAFTTLGGKIVGALPDQHHLDYWAARGVYASPLSAPDFIDALRPTLGNEYGPLDDVSPIGMLIGLARRKPHDVFISYTKSDKAFVDWLTFKLRTAEITYWRDTGEMEVGADITAKIDASIRGSYCFLVVLSRDSIRSEWVQQEIQIAMGLDESELTILPVIVGDLLDDEVVPSELLLKVYADFRSENREEPVGRVVDAVRRAVGRARGKY